MVKVWYMQAKPVNPREECHLEPAKFANLEKLASIGVLYDYVDPKDRDVKLDLIAKERGYDHSDEVAVSPKLLPDYEEKIQFFFEEHLHNDDEVRYVIDGCGYFDVRDNEDNWIRIKSEPGDLITLPAGIFHRFTPNTGDYIHVKRLFKGVPVWTAHFRKDEETGKMSIRNEYVEKFQKVIT
ncbi:1,2-dihydroxy-3-keto-5-methylthiopentene dioxygenase-like protein [Aphelenchoides besseyi]|nr:1,2-dihydroxy-3-keto-5-methylthiopentene dioxygenase-like protein [Aphelenchoides besseyi]KAI6202600.1 1,2-dihydroxy-3-keto-5-methylthiopentene dioxygenase-like protein [Aphelenchoides besseyi]